jgi:nitrogen fixation protein NifB
MKIQVANHPCFNEKKHHSHGRIHLPVAPQCNIQCNFCDRRYDCLNESRPGVTSGVLNPYQAASYLDKVLSFKNISVVGIAGPGDPFANPEETLKTLELVRQRHPELLLCLATNGLNVVPFVDELNRLDVTHVSITVNAINPHIGEKIYSFVKYGDRLFDSFEGAKILIEKQNEAVKRLKECGMVVKVNSIILPGINDQHIESIARQMSELNVDILNCIPYYRNTGSVFGHMPEPSFEMVAGVREKAGKYIRLMTHCKRCRADAAGLLNESMSAEIIKIMEECKTSVCMR